jgi:cellulose synthase/poly-beta-1,6-N-acetylglucosamine synthase-like glycosyltransferase
LVKYEKTQYLPSSSILVALRNEAESVAACIESLLSLDYPLEKLQIILINDRSTDDTRTIINKYAERYPNITVLNIGKRLESMSGKTSAIAQGMDIATGELILITDGDSVVPRGWVKAHASYYQEDIGMVGGFTLLDNKHESASWFSRIQSLDWLYLLTVGAGGIAMGRPLSILGNNMSFSKKAYHEAGGYRKMGFTIIEDFALMRQLVLKTSWRVLYPADKQMLVTSKPMPDVKQFYKQRKRWSAGGKEVGWYGKFLMFVAFASHLFLLTAWFLRPELQLFILTVLLIGIDFVLLFTAASRLERLDLLRFFIQWELFYFVYTTVFAPVLLLPTRVTWKDISYSWRINWQTGKVDEEL